MKNRSGYVSLSESEDMRRIAATFRSRPAVIPNGRTVGRFRMSIFYFILRLFVLDDCAENTIINAILCLSDALLVWVVVLGKIFGWW